MAHSPSPARRLLRGALAGVAGTLAMDLVWYRRARRSGSEADFAAWEIVRDVGSWDDAPAPGQVARKALAAVTGQDPPVARAAAISNFMHWVYGTSWVAGYALALPRRPWWSGAALGAAGSALGCPAGRGWSGRGWGRAVCSATSVPLRLPAFHEPIWKYDVPTLA